MGSPAQVLRWTIKYIAWYGSFLKQSVYQFKILHKKEKNYESKDLYFVSGIGDSCAGIHVL